MVSVPSSARRRAVSSKSIVAPILPKPRSSRASFAARVPAPPIVPPAMTLVFRLLSPPASRKRPRRRDRGRGRSERDRSVRGRVAGDGPGRLRAPASVMRAVPPIVAVPMAAGLVVSAAAIVQFVTPLTINCPPLPASEMGSSMSPSPSKVVELIVKTTPVLMVCSEPALVPSQSKVATPIVVLAVTVDVFTMRSVPVPVTDDGPANTEPAPRSSVPLATMLAVGLSVVTGIVSEPAFTVMAPVTTTVSPATVDDPALFLLIAPSMVHRLAALLTETSALSFKLSVPP